MLSAISLAHWVLLCLFSPVLIGLFSLVFVYERILLYNEERVEVSGRFARLIVKTGSILLFILVFPVILPLWCLQVLTWLISPYHVRSSVDFTNNHTGSDFISHLFNWPFLVLRSFAGPFLISPMRNLIWKPLFRRFVPFVYNRLNQRVYEPHDLSKDSIRVLRVMKGAGTEPLRCQLHEMNINHANQPFDALSYSWGGHLVLRRQIDINGRSFFVTYSVYRALLSLRADPELRDIWIDQICINQGNVQERNNQVKKMAQIYQNATRVIVWLGLAPPLLGEVFKNLKVPSPSAEEAPQIIDLSREHSNAITSILKRRWWYRLWTVQEICLAKQNTAIVRCGDDHISWPTFTRSVLSLAQSKRIQVEVPTLQFLEFVQTFHERGDGALQRTLLNLAVLFARRQASDPRDKLFALIGLVDEGDPPIEADYQKDPCQIFSCCTAASIVRTGRVDLFAIAEKHPAGLTSWAVDWSLYPTVTENLDEVWGVYGRSMIRSLAVRYSASGDYTVVRAQHDAENWQQLSLRGWYTGLVSNVSCRCSGYRGLGIVKSLLVWQVFAQSHLGRDWKPAFLQCITGGLWNGDYPHSWEGMFEVVIAQHNGNPYPARDRRDFEEQGLSRHYSDAAVQRAIEFCHIVESVCGDRAMFITDKKKLGIGPGAIWQGSAVCVIAGSAVPVLLKPADTESMNNHYATTDTWFSFDLKYKLVGLAYVVDLTIRSASDFQAEIDRGDIVEGTIHLL